MQWAQLSPELWEKVFALAKISFGRYDDEYFFMEEEEKQQQSWLHQLRTVCKSFATIFDQDPSYFRDLVLLEYIG